MELVSQFLYVYMLFLSCFPVILIVILRSSDKTFLSIFATILLCNYPHFFLLVHFRLGVLCRFSYRVFPSMFSCFASCLPYLQCFVFFPACFPAFRNVWIVVSLSASPIIFKSTVCKIERSKLHPRSASEPIRAPLTPPTAKAVWTKSRLQSTSLLVFACFFVVSLWYISQE